MKNAFETYNIIADWYEENHYAGLLQKEYIDLLIEHIGEEGSVLDVGCGTGIPVMKHLTVVGIATLGIDASYKMLAIAKRNLPNAVFLQQDMRSLSLNRKFSAIIAWNSFFHLPAADQPVMFKIFKNHLHKNGILLFTSGTKHGEAWGINGGENLYHASLSIDEYTSLLTEQGFKILRYVENDKNCGGATVWMAALIS